MIHASDKDGLKILIDLILEERDEYTHEDYIILAKNVKIAAKKICKGLLKEAQKKLPPSGASADNLLWSFFSF